MKVLLSAYACEPNKGSEPGVGWHWAQEIEKLGHQVWVLTRKNNQEVIESYFQKKQKPRGLHFIYYDVPKWLVWWKKGGRGVYLYYLLWQIGAFFATKKNHKKYKFDQIQHCTFVSVRQPSFMGLLGIPFIFGPVGGGERAPYALRRGFGWKGWLKDFIRDVANHIVRFDPLMHMTFFSADKIYVTSEQTKQTIPFFYQHKVKIKLAVGYDGELLDTAVVQKKHVNGNTNSVLKVLYVGRFECWKGMGLGIKAFSLLLQSEPKATLTMVGKGPDEARWRALAGKLGVANNIIWIPWLDQYELKALYLSHDIFLFPSLHDSGGMVVLEAMAHGLPVVCANLGGPKEMVDESCGVVATADNLVNDLEHALKMLAENPHLRCEMTLGAIKRANVFSWTKVVKSIYKHGENQ